MAPLPLVVCLALAAWAAAPRAAAQDHVRSGVEIRFVPASAYGTVSLGIFNADGKLVRVVADEWTFNRFRIGLNGLSTTWDGLDSNGQALPPGTYSARGFVVGDIGIEGEAFHFNDWIESLDSPRIERVAAAQLLPGGDVLLTARLAGATGALVRYAPESAARWETVVSGPRPEPAKQVQLAAAEQMAFALLDGQLQAASLDDGQEVALPVPSQNLKAVAARGDRLALVDEERMSFYALPSFASQGQTDDLPAEFVSVALLDQGAVAAAADGAVWRWQAGWSKLEMPEEVKVRSLSGGRDDTFWTLEERGEGVLFVAQYSPDDGQLAEWAAEEGRIVSVAGAVEKDFFVAVIDTAGGQRTAAIRRRDDGEGWQFVFDKKITTSRDFGWQDGRLVPEGGETPRNLEVVLGPNPLDPDAPRVLALQAAADDSGTGLATMDGLPLLRVSDEPGFTRVMMVAAPEADSARFFQGDGASVEEYRLTHLGRITAFDAGTIEMAGSEEVLLGVPPELEVEVEPMGDDAEE